MVILTYGLLEMSKILRPSEYTWQAVTMVIRTVLYLGGRTNKPGDSVKPNAGLVLYVNTLVKTSETYQRTTIIDFTRLSRNKVGRANKYARAGVRGSRRRRSPVAVVKTYNSRWRLR